MYLKQIALKILSIWVLKCDFDSFVLDASSRLGLGAVHSTIVAVEAHDDDVAEVGNAGLAHLGLAHQSTGVAGNCE